MYRPKKWPCFKTCSPHQQGRQRCLFSLRLNTSLKRSKILYVWWLAGRLVTLHTLYFLFICPQCVISTFRPRNWKTRVTVSLKRRCQPRKFLHKITKIVPWCYSLFSTFSEHWRVSQRELRNPIYSLKIQNPWASAEIQQRALETRWNPKSPRVYKWGWTRSENSNSISLRKPRMVKGQEGQATFSKQKACLYFMSKHTVSGRPSTTAANLN